MEINTESHNRLRCREFSVLNRKDILYPLLQMLRVDCRSGKGKRNAEVKGGVWLQGNSIFWTTEQGYYTNKCPVVVTASLSLNQHTAQDRQPKPEHILMLEGGWSLSSSPDLRNADNC